MLAQAVTQKEPMMTTTPAKTTIDAPAGDYVLTNGVSSILFKTRHMYGLGRVKGQLSVRSGYLHVVEGIAGSAVNAVVEASSFTTRNVIRDVHVRSRIFLSVKKNPTWTYESTSVVQEGADLVVKGTFTVRGNSAPVSLIIDRVEAAPNGELTIHAHGEVDRYALGVTTLRGMAARLLTFDVELAAKTA
jgi:polyisoprenoid-binding protein YceI